MAGKNNGKKLRRCAKQKSYYASGAPRTEKNKRRNIKRHIKANPTDTQAKANFTLAGGKELDIQPNAKGRRVLNRAAA